MPRGGAAARRGGGGAWGGTAGRVRTDAVSRRRSFCAHAGGVEGGIGGGGGTAGRVRTDAVSRRRLFCRWGGEGEGASWALCSDKYTALPFLSSTGQITSAAGTPLDVLPRLVLPVSSHTQGSLLQQLAHHLLDGIEGTLDLCNIRVRGKWGKDKCGGGGAGSWRHQDKRGRKGGDIRGGGGRGHA